MTEVMVKENLKARFREEISLVKSITMVALVAAFILDFIFPHNIFHSWVNYTTVAAVLISLPFTGRGTRVVCLGLMVLGGYLIGASGGGWQGMLESAGRNTNLIVLLIAVPLLGVGLRNGGYVEVMDALALKYMRTRLQMYMVPALFSHLLGVFMNLGALPLSYEVTARGRMVNYPGIMARSLSRGFSAAVFWSPNMVATALVLTYLKVSWQHYVYLGLLFSVVSLLLGLAVEFFVREDVAGEEIGGGVVSPYVDSVKLGQLAAAALVFLLIIILIETTTSLQVISTVPLLALVFPVIWLFFLGKRELIARGYADYFKTRINRFDGEVVLFAAAGFFSGALTASGRSEKLCDYIIHFSSGSRVSIALVILGAIVLSSIVGIHPMVFVSAFAASLNPAALGFAPVHMALILVTGWVLGATASPMSGICLVVGGLTGKTSLEVGYANIPHSLILVAVMLLFIAFA